LDVDYSLVVSGVDGSYFIEFSGGMIKDRIYYFGRRGEKGG
jgi:hypothetical protein